MFHALFSQYNIHTETQCQSVVEGVFFSFSLFLILLKQVNSIAIYMWVNINVAPETFESNLPGMCELMKHCIHIIS